MDPNSPFNVNVPLIGQPTIVSAVCVVLLQCNCENKTLLHGPVGNMPMQCPSCHKVWAVDAHVQMNVAQIVQQSVE